MDTGQEIGLPGPQLSRKDEARSREVDRNLLHWHDDGKAEPGSQRTELFICDEEGHRTST